MNIAFHVGLLAALSSLAHAELRTAKVFSNHMVIQRDMPAPVWGWSDPGAEISVTFSGQTKTVTANPSGRWKVQLDPRPANTTGQPMQVVSKSGESITFNDVLIGDVWICSGQSNMEWAVRQSLNAPEEIAQAQKPLIRLFDVVGHEISDSPVEELAHPTSWQICSPASVQGFSAVGYQFGRELQQQSGVPIGLLGTNWGGTRIEPWTPPVGFRSQPELAHEAKRVDAQLRTTEEGKANWKRYASEVATWSHALSESIESGAPLPPTPRSPGPISHNESTSIYNAMVAPIAGYGVRGAIWYQGESNSGEGLAYLPKLKALVEGWRSVWNQPEDFPLYFYVVKLAQFHQPNANPAGGDGFATIRIAQDRIVELPHTGVASAIDIGNATDIHPGNKQDVGKRLARLALHDIYGKESHVPCGPSIRSIAIEGNKAILSFNHVGGGLMKATKEGLQAPRNMPDAPLRHFAIAGTNNQWHWGEAKIVGDTVEVTSPAVASPVAVRYAFAGNPEGANLYNKDGLPAVPFATDLWLPESK